MTTDQTLIANIQALHIEEYRNKVANLTRLRARLRLRSEVSGAMAKDRGRLINA